MARYRYTHKSQVRNSVKLWLRSIGVLFVIAVIIGIAYINRDSLPIASETDQTATTQQTTPAYTNAVEERAIVELRQYHAWLTENDVKGYIGEFGWQENTDADQWKAIADTWLKEVKGMDMWATAWAAGSYWGDYPLTIYGSSDPSKGLNLAKPQAQTLHNYLTDQTGSRFGINVAGMEFDAENLSNAKTGVAGQDYFYEPATSFSYLKAQGIDLIRVPIRWERVQPALNGPLDQKEITAIKSILSAAQTNNIDVILDLHNYGGYRTKNGEVKLGSPTLGAVQLEDIWLKLSKEFRSNPAIIGYTLMNEPHDIIANNTADAAERWEGMSQRVVNGLRNSGDTNTLMIPGYDWSSLRRWTQNHPKPWIKDPANNIRYEAHHYWDSDGSGTYTKSFADEVSNIQN